MPDTDPQPSSKKLIPDANSPAQQSQSGAGKPATRTESSKSNNRGVTFSANDGNPATTETQSNQSPSPKPATGIIGSRMDRVDARLKVTGRAHYAADYPLQNMAYGVAIRSTIARGRITGFDLEKAKAMPGVITIITHENTPPVFRARGEFDTATKQGEKRQVFEDDRVHYVGQFIGLVVANTLEEAVEAQKVVKVNYADEPGIYNYDAAIAANLKYEPEQMFGEPLKTERGDAQTALASATVKVQGKYSTPVEHHNPMEMHAAIAVWDGDSLRLYDATQRVVGSRNVVAESIGASPEDVRVVSRFVGGGFGCKGFIWPHETLAAIAAKVVKRPVKVMLSRREMFTNTGHRAGTQQEVTLASDAAGKLAAIVHNTLTHTSMVDEFVETCGKVTTLLYNVANLQVNHELVPLNLGTPTPTRAPGESVGTFALESAMDELAHELKMDPIQLRLVNHADESPAKNKPWSSKYLKECYARGAELIGWDKRKAEPGATRDGNWLVGYGMATATYPGMRSPGAAKVRINADGTALVTSATQDIGTGTYTTMTMVAAQSLGLSPDKIKAELGDSRLPPAPVSGGSMTTASVLPAVEYAADQAIKKLGQLAIDDEKSPLHGAKIEEIVAKGEGRLGSTKDSALTDTFTDILKRKRLAAVEGESFTQPGPEQQKYHFQSFGAIFAEVGVDPDLGITRLRHLVGVYDAGRIINMKTATSNLMGGIVWGVGMALLEHTVYDERNGRPVTDNLADYLVPVCADIPRIDVETINKPDPYLNPQGTRGVGEIGITGVAAAIANAVFNATGKRIRDLPITPEKVLIA
jgi:xanthine dehydrogenase YagR molybdenum-binding subunit